MSDSSDCEVNIEIPYSSRPEWSDLKPISQDDETNDIVRIAYTEAFKEVYDYFRAVLRTNELSERAFELSKDAALLNPANYTVWYYRRLLIKHLNKDLNDELDFITNVIRSHPKNYQVWQHRRNIVEYLQDPSQELLFTKQILKKDSKNYHAWQYRQWIIKTFSLWSEELNYIDELLKQDIRNNSAWNQRYFYLSNNFDLTQESSRQVLNDEINYCMEKIQLCIDNESSWNYLRALINNLANINEAKNRTTVSITDYYPELLSDFCTKKLNSDKEEDRSPFLISFYIDYNRARISELLTKLKSTTNASNIKDDDHNQSATTTTTTDSNNIQLIKDLVRRSIEMLESLATKHDTIRANYWNYLVSKWKQDYIDFC